MAPREGLYQSCSVLHRPEATGLIEPWNSLLKTQLQCQLGGSTLQGRSQVLQWDVHALN